MLVFEANSGSDSDFRSGTDTRCDGASYDEVSESGSVSDSSSLSNASSISLNSSGQARCSGGQRRMLCFALIAHVLTAHSNSALGRSGGPFIVIW
jgi:hypothetical protein